MAVEFSSPASRLLYWAALPFGWRVELVEPGEPVEGYDLLIAFTPDAFPGESRTLPGPKALGAAADLLVAKRLIRALGIPTPGFGRVEGEGELAAMVRVHGLPARLRPRRGGPAIYVDSPDYPPPKGSFVYERAYPYRAELLLLAVGGGGVSCLPPAWREGEAWLFPFELEEGVAGRVCGYLERLLLALGHRGVLEARAGLLPNGEIQVLDFQPYPGPRSLFLPELAEAHIRAGLGWAVPPPPVGPRAVVPARSLEAVAARDRAHPFVLDRVYARLEARGAEELRRLVRELGEGVA